MHVWLERLEMILRDHTSDEAVWSRNLRTALPFAVVAFALGWAFDRPIGLGDPLDAVAYPLLTLICTLLELLLLRRPSSTNLVTLLLVFGTGLFFSAKLVFILFLAGPDVHVGGELTETFYWLPALYVMAAMIPKVELARRMTETYLATVVVLTLCYALFNHAPLHGQILFALAQLSLANVTLYALTLSGAVHERGRTQRMQRMALTDTLTGLVNRLGLETELDATVVQARDHQQVFALLFLDLDGFKMVNDRLGHEVGDALLKEVAQRLGRIRRESDVLARLGGDEFVLLARGATRAAASDLVDRVLQAFSLPFESSRGLPVGASIGFSAFPTDGQDSTTLMASADQRMYEVKRARKNGGHPQGRTLDVRQALETGQLTLRPRPLLPASPAPDVPPTTSPLSVEWTSDPDVSPEQIWRSALLDGEQGTLLDWWCRQVGEVLSSTAPGASRSPGSPPATADSSGLLLIDLPQTLLHQPFGTALQREFQTRRLPADAPARLLFLMNGSALHTPGPHLSELDQLTGSGAHLTLQPFCEADLERARHIRALLQAHEAGTRTTVPEV